MQNECQNDSATTKRECISTQTSESDQASTSSLVLKKAQVMATIPQNLSDNFMPDLSPSDEEEVSEVESFILDQEDLEDGDPSRFLLSHETIEGAEVRTVDPETQAKLEALLEAAGIGKLSTPDGKAYADPEVLRRLTSSVSCALDEAAAALTRMRAEQQAEGATGDSRSLAKACSSGDIGTVRQLLDEGRSVNETTEEGESLLSLACSAGYYELAQVLLAMRANVEDRGIKGDCTPLMEAASGGYVDIVKLLIANGADVNAQSSQGNTPLHYAACGGHEDVVRVLIEATANVEEHNENGHTPLMEAASAGHVGVAKILLDAGAGINTHSNEFKESALTLACYKGHLEMVKFLLEAGADQEHKTDEMHTALMEASMDGHVEVARLLLDSGAQVNMPADSFESPLTLAACGGHVELANLLIERGANLEEVNDEGYTPLMEAAREGHEEMVALLLAHGADINAQTEETQETALTLACCGGFVDVAEFLIKAGADLELGCSTPLMEAAQEGHLELVKYLIKAGANVHAQTQTGDTALTYACENGHSDVTEVLLDNKGLIEHESEGGRTPVMKAARAGHFSTVQFLISRGADVNKQTSTNDHTVLSLASAGGHRSVVDLLLKSGSNPNHRLKDGSTMLIEAAKGGHTTVVNLLLDWPGNLTTSTTDLTQMSPPQSGGDINELPRVPIHGLTNIVPPQDPDQVPASDTNNLSTNNAVIGVPQISGQVNLKDFNIQTKSLEPLRPDQIRPTMQKLLAKSKLGTLTVTTTTTTTTSSQGLVVSESGDNATPPTTAPGALHYNNNDPQKVSGNTKNGALASGSRLVSSGDGSLSRSSSQVSDVGSDFGADGEHSNPDVSTSSSSSTAFDSEDKMNEMMKASERLEAFISKMMRRAELLHTTSEEQSLQKQQILEELQKVEQELQEKAKNPLLLLNAQSKQELSGDRSRAGSGAAQAVQVQMAVGPDGQLFHQPIGMTLPVQLCESSPNLLLDHQQEGDDSSSLLPQLESASSLPVIPNASQEEAHNGGALSFLGGGAEDGPKTPQLAKQESFSSASNSSSSSSTADSGCGHSDFNGVGVEGSEVDGLPLQSKNTAAIESVQEEESGSAQESSSTVSSPLEQMNDQASGRLAASEGSSRASSEEVDLTNVVPAVIEEVKDQADLDGQLPVLPEDEQAQLEQAQLDQAQLDQHLCQVLQIQEQAQLDEQLDIQLRLLQKHELLQQQVQQQLKAGADPTKIALGIQQQLQQQQLQQQQQLSHLAQQCLQTYPVPLESLPQQSIATVLNPNNTSPTAINSSCRELQLEHQRQQLQAQLELEQAKTKTLQAQLQLQKQIKTSSPQSTTKYQQLKVQQQTTVTCQTQLAASDLQQLKIQQQLQQLHQQLSSTHQLTVNQQLSQQELLQQQLQQAQKLHLLHQQHLQKQQHQVTASTCASSTVATNQTSQTQTTAAGQLPANQLLSQQDLLQQTQQLQQQLQQVQQLQQMQHLAQQQKHLGQFQGNMWPVTTAAAVTSTAAAATPNNNNQKKPKKKQLLPQQQQQLLQQQLLVNNQLNTQYANYTTASTNTMATGNNTLYDYLDMITPSSSTPMTPNPSPASPLISPPVYPAIDLDAETDSNHDTALTLACAGGHAELVSLLLSRGADIEHRDKKGFTPLILASTAGHSDVVEILLDHGADIEAQSERTKDTPLSLACSGGRYEVVELLLTRGANKEHRNVSDYTPLSLAASGGYVNIIKLLLSHGAEINSRTGSKLGISPLMLAAMNGHTAAVKLLLDMGSDINAQIETNKNTALTLACFQGRHEVVSLLVDRKANIEHRAKTGLTPLMEAASGGYVEVGRVLLDKGADVNAPPVPSSRDTALTIAADKGHYRFVDLLLSRHAAIDVKNKKGNSPLWLASNGGHLDVVQLLVQAGADVDSQDNRKVSCLMAAYRKGHIKVIKWLVKHVTQFPSDSECMRYISTVTDQELLKKCHQCMDIIVSAKARQAAEANRNASILLEEIDAEKSREENKKAAAARKREKKRKKKKEKQEREQEKKELVEKEKEPADTNSKSCSPEPEIKDADDDDDDDEDEEEEEERIQKTQVNKKDGTESSLSETLRSSVGESRTSSHTESAPISSTVTNKNNRNKALGRVEAVSQVVNKLPVKTIPEPSRTGAGTGNAVNGNAITAAIPSSSPVVSSSGAGVKGKSRRKQRDKDRRGNNKDRDRDNAPDKGRDNAPDKGTAHSMASSGPSSTKASNTGSGKNSAGIGDLDDFGMLPPAVKVAQNKEKEKRVPDKPKSADTFSNANVLSPAKSNSGKSPGGPSPSKRGSKKEEGWKEVIRNSVRRSKKVTVPANAISRVIGRNGSNINAIREVSGAHIDIDKARSSGDRNITIKGSAEATRQAQNLIAALIKDPDKDLDQIIPKLKNRAVSTSTLGLSTNMWHNSMANGVPANTAPTTATVVTTLVTTFTTAMVGSKGGSSKSGAAITKSTGLATTVTTTVTQSMPGKSTTVTNSNVRPQTSTLSNIGVFQVPIGVWKSNMTQASSPSSNKLSSSPGTPARRQLFPGNHSAAHSTASKPMVTYSSPSMAKTKVVTVTAPAIASRVENKAPIPTSMSRTQPPQSQLKAMGISPGRPSGGGTLYSGKEPQPLPIKTSCGPGGAAGNKAGPAATAGGPGPAVAGVPGSYSPFNNVFSQFAEQVLGKKEENVQDGKMNFASVAAAGVIPTSVTSHGMPSVGAAPHPASLQRRETDASLQAKAPGYKAPGSQRTSSPQVADHEMASRAPGYRVGPGPSESDNPRVPGFKPGHFGNPALMEYDMSRIAENYGMFSPQHRQQGMEHIDMSRMSGVPLHSVNNISPRSASSTPVNTQSPRHHHLQNQALGLHKDVYTTPDQPMTLPKIESNLNPNAPDFTFRAQADNHQLQQQLLAAQMLAHQQQALMGGMSSTSNASPPFLHPSSMRLPPPFLMNQQQNLGTDMSGSSSQSQSSLGIPDNMHQMGAFGSGPAGYQSVGSGLGDSGNSLSPSLNRQYSPMPPSAVRSESAASSVGTSSKGESSPVLHVSEESSPLSSSAPSPTDQVPVYLEDRHQQSLQQATLRPIGTGRSSKKDRGLQTHFNNDMGDNATAAENLWGIARELGTVMSPSVSLMSRTLQTDNDNPRTSAQSGMTPQFLPNLMSLDPSLLETSAVEMTLQSQAALLAPSSGSTLFASGIPTGPVGLSYTQSGMGLPGDGLGGMWNPRHQPQGHVGGGPTDPGVVDPKMMWNSWTPPPTM